MESSVSKKRDLIKPPFMPYALVKNRSKTTHIVTFCADVLTLADWVSRFPARRPETEYIRTLLRLPYWVRGVQESTEPKIVVSLGPSEFLWIGCVAAMGKKDNLPETQQLWQIGRWNQALGFQCGRLSLFVRLRSTGPRLAEPRERADRS